MAKNKGYRWNATVVASDGRTGSGSGTVTPPPSATSYSADDAKRDARRHVTKQIRDAVVIDVTVTEDK